jgi:hypothetical protein
MPKVTFRPKGVSMSLPITYSEEFRGNSYDGPGSSYDYVYRARQGRPYDLPSTYVRMKGYTVAALISGVYTGFGGLANAWTHKGGQVWGPDVRDVFVLELQQANNNAYEKFADKVKGAEAMLAVNIAERNQALEMIASRAKQLLQFCNFLRRRQFQKAAACLGVKTPKSVRHLGRDVSAAFLEFHFGWEPLIGDIGAGVDILQGDVPDKHIRSRGKPVTKDFHVHLSDDFTVTDYGTKVKVQTSCSARVVVTNPSLHAADQWGFVNPVSVAWELVPFSFVVDWFVPVSSFLNSMTDFLGLEMDQTCYFSLIHTPAWVYTQGYVRPDIHLVGTKTVATTGYHASRTLGIPSVTLVPRRVSGISPVRAATAVSLLLQQGLRGLH